MKIFPWEKDYVLVLDPETELKGEIWPSNADEAAGPIPEELWWRTWRSETYLAQSSAHH